MTDARYRGSGGTHDGSHVVPEAWTYIVSIRNDGSRSGEIRNSIEEVYESEPSNIASKLRFAHGSIDGIYPKGESRQVHLSIAYMDRGPDTLLRRKQITKLVAILKWNRETRKGFSPDIRILNLIPEPQIQD